MGFIYIAITMSGTVSIAVHLPMEMAVCIPQPESISTDMGG
jgi:hypothetical protein